MKPDDSHTSARLREVLKGLPQLEADRDYRQRLARRFVSGDFEREAAPWSPRGRSRRPVLAWAAAVLALATALAVYGLRPEQPSWRVVAATGEGDIGLDGVPVAAGDSETWGARLRAGIRVQIPDGGELTVVSTDGVVLQLTAGTDMTLPAAGWWPWQESWNSRIATGEARITTAQEFRGRKVRIASDEARIEVTGTTLAVIKNSDGICVCVFAGRVRMGARGAPLEVVDAGRRHVVFSDGKPELTEDILPMEKTKLGMLQDQRESLLSQ